MKIFETIVKVLAYIGFILLFQRIDGGALLFTVATIILAIIYLFAGIILLNNIPLNDVFKKNSYQDIGKWSVGLSLFCSIALSLIVISILSIIIWWEGSNTMILLAYIIGIATLILAALSYYDNRKPVYVQMMNRLIPYLIFLYILT